MSPPQTLRMRPPTCRRVASPARSSQPPGCRSLVKPDTACPDKLINDVLYAAGDNTGPFALEVTSVVGAWWGSSKAERLQGVTQRNQFALTSKLYLHALQGALEARHGFEPLRLAT